MSRVLNLVLTHQSPKAVAAMLVSWDRCVPRESILLAYGGRRSDFEAITGAEKVYVDDVRLRTRDHTRERQSYAGVMRAAAAHGALCEAEFVHFAEYDHLPLAPGLNARQIALLRSEAADVLGYHVRRVDGTNCPHFLYAAAERDAARFWRTISRRADPGVVLSMIATGSFWARESFEAVAATVEPHPIYVEIFLPTVAHHLGFRLRDYGEQTRFVRHAGDWQGQVEEARRRGAWTVHPVKGMWG